MTSSLSYPVEAPTDTIEFGGDNDYGWTRINPRYRQRGRADGSGDSVVSASRRTEATLRYNFKITANGDDIDTQVFKLDKLFSTHPEEEMKLTLVLNVTKVFIVKVKSLAWGRRTANTQTLDGSLSFGVVEILS